MIWVLLGALGVSISESLGLSAAQKGLMVAVPILSGSLMRIPLGLLSDAFGGRRVGIAMLLALYLPLAGGLAGGDVARRTDRRRSVARCRGRVVRRRAAAGEPLVSAGAAGARDGDRRCGKQRHRRGESRGAEDRRDGRVARRARADDDPVDDRADRVRDAREGQPDARDHAVACRATSPCCASASCGGSACSTRVTFGGYVGLSSFMPILLRDQYRLPAVTAGYLTALAALAGSASAAAGRVRGRSHRRRAAAVGAASLGIAAMYAAASRIPALTSDGRGARDGDDLSRARQRRGVPARAAVLPPPDRHRDGRGRRGGRPGRVHAPHDARSVQAAHRLVRRGVHRARLHGGVRAPAAALAHGDERELEALVAAVGGGGGAEEKERREVGVTATIPMARGPTDASSARRAAAASSGSRSLAAMLERDVCGLRMPGITRRRRGSRG